MARHTRPVKIESDDPENRDRGKVFVITEMSAFAGDAWAKRALLAAARGEVNPALIADIENAGLAGVAALGFQFLGSLRWDDSKPLLDELLACVQYMPDITKPTILRPIGLGGAEDIEEIATITFLQMEAFNLHVNFSKLVASLKSKVAAMMARLAASQGTPT